MNMSFFLARWHFLNRFSHYPLSIALRHPFWWTCRLLTHRQACFYVSICFLTHALIYLFLISIHIFYTHSCVCLYSTSNTKICAQGCFHLYFCKKTIMYLFKCVYLSRYTSTNKFLHVYACISTHTHIGISECVSRN